MNFRFLLDINVLTFVMVFVVFGFWQILKIITKKDYDPRLITTVNGAIAVVYALIIAATIGGGFFELVVTGGTVFAAGSFFDLLKAYGAVKE